MDYKIAGVLILVANIYLGFAAYRAIKYKELYWFFPHIYHRRKRGYSHIICNIVGFITITLVLFFSYIAFNLIFHGN